MQERKSESSFSWLTGEFRDLGLRVKIIIGSCAPAFVVLALGTFSLFNLASLRETSEWVEHTHNVIGNAREIGKLILDLETGERGFLIVGEERFLEPYKEAGETLHRKLLSLREQVADNPVQATRIRDIEILLDDWHLKAGDPEIRARRAMSTQTENGLTGVNMGELIQLIRSGVGKGLMDQIRQSLAEFVDVEQSLLTEREATIARERRAATMIFVGATFVTFAAVLILSFLIAQTILRPVTTLLGAVQSVADGDLNHQVEIHSADEIGKLAEGFNRMVFELRAIDEETKSLLRTIQERTAELLDANKRLEQEIRDRMEAETRARHHQDLLAHVSRTHVMSEMATNIAHELNQPLAAIGNYAQACIDRAAKGPPEARELMPILEKLVGQLERAGEIIRHVRGFISKGDSNRSFTDINQMIRDTISMLNSDPEYLSLKIELDLVENLPELLVNPIQIEQVLINLVRNAREAMAEAESRNGLKVLTSSSTEKGMVISVSDTGAGMTAEIRDDLFKPFTTAKKDGLGMGLAISRTIVETHGGQIWVTPNPPQGTTVEFSLPFPTAGEETETTPI